MTSRIWLRMLAAFGLSTTIVGCGGNPRPQIDPAIGDASAPAASAPVAQTALQRRTPADPVVTLIATSQKHFDNGERELKLGHLDRARTEFDRAVDVLLESRYGARTDPRMREHFDRLIDRISAHEVSALAQG